MFLNFWRQVVNLFFRSKLYNTSLKQSLFSLRIQVSSSKWKKKKVGSCTVSLVQQQCSHVCMTAIILRIGVMRKNKKLSSHCHASILMMILLTQHSSEHIFQCCYELHCLRRLVFLKYLFIKFTFFPFLSAEDTTKYVYHTELCLLITLFQ